MKSIETPEIIFMNQVHETTSNADKLLEIYSESLAIIETLPDELEFPNKAETLELTRLTLDTILELKVLVTSLTEHAAEMNDAIEAAVAKLNLKKD